MKFDADDRETHSDTGMVEGNARGSSEVRGGDPIWGSGGYWSNSLRQNWVSPWLALSNSTVCPYRCVMGTN